MYYKVRIKSLPKAKVGYQVDGSLSNDVLSFGDSKAKPELKVNKFITAVPRKDANLEAEGGELVYGDIDGDNFLENTEIKGPRHTNGGVPLNLPDDTFIFSDTAGMKINDPVILKMFGKLSKKGKGNKGFTPAVLAKQYDINSYKKILLDPNSDAISIKTAELMIKNYNMKLGALALAQEAKKGFPQGIPTVAESYMEMMGIDPKDILPPELPEPMSPQQLTQGEMQEQPVEENSIEEDPTSDQMANDDTLTQSQPNLEQYAQPEESFANPEEMMQYGGMRRLRKAEEGGSDDMEVPPELESECYEEASWPGGPRKKKKSCRELIEAWHKRKERQDKVTRFFMNAGQTALELGLAGSAAIGSGYLAPKESGWGKMMRTVGSKIGDFFQEDGGAIGYNDSMRTLRRAQEGMQQMSEEEMIALQQEQAQLQAEQQLNGKEAGMMQEQPQIDEEKIQMITQQVEQALQQGAPPQEIVTQLLKAKIPANLIEQIFIQLGMPQEEVKELLMSLIQNVENEQAQQIDPRQQQQQISEEDMMAMQQQDPRQMQQAPMAAYGMSMGGYDMPYAQNGYSYSDEDETEMSEDTNPCPPCPDGSIPTRTDSGDCPCSDTKEKLKFYDFALKERESIMNQPAMWNEDPDMMNPDGSYKFCVDCLVKDYNDPDVVKSVSALINDGIANFPKYDYPDLIKGLEKFNLPMPVYQSNIKKSKGGVINSRPLSMAQYGMDMGGYDMPFTDNSYEMAFGGQRKFNKDHVTVLKFQGGGQPPDGVIIKRADYQTDELYRAAVKREIYNNRGGKKVYTLNKEGKYSSVTEKIDDGSGYKGDMTNWSGNLGAASRFASMKKSLEDPVVAKLFAQSTREALKDKESYKRKGKGNRYNSTWADHNYENPDNLKDEEIVNEFLEHQERNLKLAASGNESFLYNDVDGKLRKKNGTGTGDNLGFVELMQGLKKADGSRLHTDAEIEAKYQKMLKEVPTLDKAFESIGLPMTAVNKGTSPANRKARLQQATFIGYDNLIKKAKAGKLTADEKYLLDEWQGNLERGYNDEKLGDSSRISPTEGIYTNTTAGQISNKTQNTFEEKLLPEECFCTVDGKEVPGKTNPNYDASKPKSSTNDPCAPCPETPGKKGECQCIDESLDTFQPLDKDGNCTCTPPDEEDKWWLQDNISITGAASDLASIKKYLPWAPRLDLEEPRPLFLDQTVAQNNNTAQANVAQQANASFADASGARSTASSIQAKSAQNAAQIASQYDNQNANIGNQFEDKQVNIRNQETVGNQQISTQQFDKNTIANQQYDNSTLALRGTLRSAYKTGLTNKANTAMLNRLHPNQRVRPEDGGMPNFVDSGREFDGTQTSNGYNDLLEECRLLYPAGTATELNNCVKTKSGFQGNPTKDPGGLVNSYPSTQYGGQQQPVKQFKYGGFIYNVYPDY